MAERCIALIERTFNRSGAVANRCHGAPDTWRDGGTRFESLAA
jgi:hypothetical protein